VKKANLTKMKKKTREYKEGREALENLEAAMKGLFRSPKLSSKKLKKGGRGRGGRGQTGRFLISICNSSLG